MAGTINLEKYVEHRTKKDDGNDQAKSYENEL